MKDAKGTYIASDDSMDNGSGTTDPSTDVLDVTTGTGLTTWLVNAATGQVESKQTTSTGVMTMTIKAPPAPPTTTTTSASTTAAVSNACVEVVCEKYTMYIYSPVIDPTQLFGPLSDGYLEVECDPPGALGIITGQRLYEQNLNGTWPAIGPIHDDGENIDVEFFNSHVYWPCDKGTGGIVWRWHQYAQVLIDWPSGDYASGTGNSYNHQILCNAI